MKTRPGSPKRKRVARAEGPSGRAPSYADLVQIVELIRSASNFREFRLRSGDIEVEMRRANGAAGPAQPAAASTHGREPVGAEVTLEPERAALRVPHAHADAEKLPPGLALVRAPMVGTFYRAPEPGALPFVEPGTRVAPDTIVCIIEVMKLMNSIPAGCAGVVTHVLVNNAEPIEYGQPLLAIDPD
jgi:acetyl-CoA carboxylase biotin carboxyl carrier protein